MDNNQAAHFLLDHFLDSNGEYVFLRLIVTLLTLVGFIIFEGLYHLVRWANRQNNLYFIDDHHTHDVETGSGGSLPERVPLLQPPPPLPSHDHQTRVNFGHTLNATATTATSYLWTWQLIKAISK